MRSLCRAFQYRSLFDHYVGIGTTYTEGAHSCSQRALASPLLQFIIHIEGAVGKVKLLCRCSEVETWHQSFVLQGQGRFDKSCHSCCCIEVSYVGLYRADAAEAFFIGSKCLSQCFQFDRITEGGTCTVALYIGDLLWRNSCRLLCCGNHFYLPLY